MIINNAMLKLNCSNLPSQYSIYTKHRKSSFLSLENPWKLVESHFITAPNVKKCEKQY